MLELWLVENLENHCNGQEKFQTNLGVHCINTRNKYCPHRTTANFPCFQKNTYHAVIKTYNGQQVS
jgi:hypothetical protein